MSAFVPPVPVSRNRGLSFPSCTTRPSFKNSERRPCYVPQRGRRLTPRASSVLPEQHSPERLGFLHIGTVTGPHGVHGQVKVTSTTDFASHRLSPTATTQRFLLLPGRRYPRPVKIIAAKQASRKAVWILRLGPVMQRAAAKAPEDIDYLRLRGARLFVRAVERPPLRRGEFVAADLPGLRVTLRNEKLEPAFALAEAAAVTAAAAAPAAEVAGDTRNSVEQAATTPHDLQQPYYVAKRKRGTPLAAGLPIGVVTSVITAADLCSASGASKAAAKVANDLLEIALFEHDDLRIEAPFEADIPEKATRVLVPFVKQIVPVVDRDAALVVLDPPPGLLDIAVVNSAERPRPPRGLLMPAPSVSPDASKA